MMGVVVHYSSGGWQQEASGLVQLHGMAGTATELFAIADGERCAGGSSRCCYAAGGGGASSPVVLERSCCP
jgi:hypothetical protein